MPLSRLGTWSSGKGKGKRLRSESKSKLGGSARAKAKAKANSGREQNQKQTRGKQEQKQEQSLRKGFSKVWGGKIVHGFPFRLQLMEFAGRARARYVVELWKSNSGTLKARHRKQRERVENGNGWTAKRMRMRNAKLRV